VRSVTSLENYSKTSTLAADDITELHAARLLLLLSICGKDNSIEGLTKLAKLDFFLRYPKFFERVQAREPNTALTAAANALGQSKTESPMVRYKYGPWDNRYYQLLAYLESRNLITIDKLNTKTYRFTLTALGDTTAQRLQTEIAFLHVVAHAREVSKLFRSVTGNKLKNLIYKEFTDEVSDRKLGEVIE
jgi:hypothetical protein